MATDQNSLQKPANPVAKKLAGLTAVVITLNSASSLRRCLQSLCFAQEVIVLDGGSSDQTRAIALECGASFYENSDWKGFGVQKNRAIDLAKNDWILLLDSDEWFESQAVDELESTLRAGTQSDTAPVAFRFRRRSRYLGVIVRHSGWWPDHVTRLFRRDAARYSEDWVHERLVLNSSNRLGTLRSVIEHDAVVSVEQVLGKTNRYSSLSAQQMGATGRRASVGTAVGKGIWAFVRTFIFQLGFLDGRVGFLIAFHSAETTFYRYLKLWESHLDKSRPSN